MDTAERMLKLLSMLQSRMDWTGEELAERLGVTPRTVRRDIGRLRNLGYPVEALAGPGGGYRLGSGGKLPPLMLDDEEALAVALGLRLSAAGAVGGLEDASVSAMASWSKCFRVVSDRGWRTCRLQPSRSNPVRPRASTTEPSVWSRRPFGNCNGSVLGIPTVRGVSRNGMLNQTVWSIPDAGGISLLLTSTGMIGESSGSIG